METKPGSGEDDTLICHNCCGYLHIPFGSNDRDRTAACCPVCLGLFSMDAADVEGCIDKACEPYGGMEANRFSMENPPSIVLPGDVALRYHLAALDAANPEPLSSFLYALKTHLKRRALELLQSRQKTVSTQEYPDCVEAEEQGFLCLHIVISPIRQAVSRPSSFVMQANKKRIRKRFRGNDPTEKQGGDPRQNLERRLLKQGVELWSCADVETVVNRAAPPAAREAWEEWFRTSASISNPAVNYNVAVWRRPFYLRGLYTKSRRDVSQTPFYVPSEENGAAMKRLGVTSVEEQINPVISKVACGGISTLNNDPDGGDTVYSMIKFHASGREDMDVRMLLPAETTDNVGGRPFVCQVVDALRMPTMDQVKQVTLAINHTTMESNAVGENDEFASRSYGRNPLGVDISSCFTFVPSLAFKNLQSETEEKVKYYGCLCWCEREIASQEELQRRLGSFPLEIRQKTPIRVLHRRSNAIRTRHVLTLKPTMIDKHHFRLNLCTDAGTYVKEFCHGDLGRTIPSVSSLLGCKTDILELDCEGIAGV